MKNNLAMIVICLSLICVVEQTTHGAVVVITFSDLASLDGNPTPDFGSAGFVANENVDLHLTVSDLLVDGDPADPGKGVFVDVMGRITVIGRQSGSVFDNVRGGGVIIVINDTDPAASSESPNFRFVSHKNEPPPFLGNTVASGSPAVFSNPNSFKSVLSELSGVHTDEDDQLTGFGKWEIGYIGGPDQVFVPNETYVVSVSEIPEPASLVIWGLAGLLGLFVQWNRIRMHWTIPNNQIEPCDPEETFPSPHPSL